MRIRITSAPVNDQEKALKFYTEKPGFVKKTDIPVGEYRWLTVVPPEDNDGVELLLEPLGFPPARTYQKELFNADTLHFLCGRYLGERKGKIEKAPGCFHIRTIEGG